MVFCMQVLNSASYRRFQLPPRHGRMPRVTAQALPVVLRCLRIRSEGFGFAEAPLPHDE